MSTQVCNRGLTHKRDHLGQNPHKHLEHNPWVLAPKTVNALSIACQGLKRRLHHKLRARFAPLAESGGTVFARRYFGHGADRTTMCYSPTENSAATQIVSVIVLPVPINLTANPIRIFVPGFEPNMGTVRWDASCSHHYPRRGSFKTRCGHFDWSALRSKRLQRPIPPYLESRRRRGYVATLIT